MNLLGDDFWNCFRVRCSWFDSRYMFLPVYDLIWKKITRFYVPGWTSDRISSRSGRSENGIFAAFCCIFRTPFAWT